MLIVVECYVKHVEKNCMVVCVKINDEVTKENCAEDYKEIKKKTRGCI